MFRQFTWDCKCCWWVSCRWNSIVLCNWRIVPAVYMVPPRLLFAVAALVILFFFCSWTSKIVLESLHESCDKRCVSWFFSSWCWWISFWKWFQNLFCFAPAWRSGFGAAISDAVMRNSVVLCKSISAHRIVIAASWLLRALAAFVILLFFAAGLEKSYWVDA